MAFQGAGENILRDGGRPVSTMGTWATGNFFSTLGVKPVYGRNLRPSDDIPGAAPVMVIGYGFWQRYFGGSPAAEACEDYEAFLREGDPQRPATLRGRKRVRAIPGVTGTASLPSRPFSGEGGWTAMYTGEGQTPGAQATNPWVNLEVVGPEYFGTLGIPIRRGRGFSEQDRAPRVAVISEAVARATWPGEDPIGKRIKLGASDGSGDWYGVVGVVGDTRYHELTDPQPSLYLPIRQFAGPVPTTLAVRTRSDPVEVVPQIRRALREISPEWAIVGGGSMQQLLSAPLARPRFSTLLLGIAGALAGTRVLHAMLFEISTTDATTFAAVTVLMLGAAALACYLPARRAARVDPVETLASN